MSLYKVSVIIPVIFLNEYSRKALIKIKESASSIKQILFVIPCSDRAYEEITTIFTDSANCHNVKIVPTNNEQSNALRYLGAMYSETPYVYYQDCDDEVRYDLIIDSLKYCTGDNVLCFNINRKQYDTKMKNVYCSK